MSRLRQVVQPGDRFGDRVVLLERAPDRHGHRIFKCRCEQCGTVRYYRLDWLNQASHRPCKVCNARKAA